MVRGVSPNVRRRTTVPPAFDHDGGPGYAGGMIARRTVVALLPLALVASGACSRARSAPPPSAEGGDPQAVVARIDGHVITQKEVDARAQGSLQQIRDEEYEARHSALDELITERLMDAQATAQGISRDELMKREVDAKVQPPTKAEVQELYDRNKDRVGGRTLAELTPEIEHSILQQRSVDRAQAYLAELRGKAQVVVSLPQPRNEVQIPADARALGPEKAPVTIVEFSDYLCPFCQKAQSVVDEYRPNLLEAPGDWTDEDLLRRTASLGLDRAGLQACLSSDRHDKAILDSSEEGKALGVQSTPTFFINGRRLRGVRSADQFQEIIDSELGVRPGQS